MTSVYRVNQNFSPVSSFSIQNMTDSGNPTIIEKAGRRYFVGMRTISTTKYVIVYCTDLDGNLIYQKNFNWGSPLSFQVSVMTNHTVFLTLIIPTSRNSSIPDMFILDSTGNCYRRRSHAYVDSNRYWRSAFYVLGEEYEGTTPCMTPHNIGPTGVRLMRLSDTYMGNAQHYLTSGSYTKAIRSVHERFAMPGKLVCRVNHIYNWTGDIPYEAFLRVTHTATSMTSQTINWGASFIRAKYCFVNENFDTTFAYSLQTDGQSQWPVSVQNTYFNIIETWPDGQSAALENRQRVRILYRNDKSASFDITRMWEDTQNLNLQILVDGVNRIYSLKKSEIDQMETDSSKAVIQFPYDIVMCISNASELFETDLSTQNLFRGLSGATNQTTAVTSWRSSETCATNLNANADAAGSINLNTSASNNANLFQDIVYQNSAQAALPQVLRESFPALPPSQPS